MPRVAYVNGRYLPHAAASVHVEDRGYQFADGIYEVTPVVHGVPVDEAAHLDRLERSLSELRIAMPMSRRGIEIVSAEMIRRNALTYGFVYIQVTRGVAPRDHKFPAWAKPSLVMSTRQMTPPTAEKLDGGISVVTIPDRRWKRCDIKSVSLLPNVLGKQEAAEAGASEAWMVDDEGYVTEGTSTNAWIVTDEGALVTRPLANDILSGVTRLRLLQLARDAGVPVEERPFTVEEAKRARETFLTSSTNFVMPVTRIDDATIGNGHAGLLSLRLRKLYENYIENLKNAA